MRPAMEPGPLCRVELPRILCLSGGHQADRRRCSIPLLHRPVLRGPIPHRPILRKPIPRRPVGRIPGPSGGLFPIRKPAGISWPRSVPACSRSAIAGPASRSSLTVPTTWRAVLRALRRIPAGASGFCSGARRIRSGIRSNIAPVRRRPAMRPALWCAGFTSGAELIFAGAWRPGK